MDKRALYFREMLPSIEQLLKDLPENCESRTMLEVFGQLPPKAFVIELETDGDFGVSNIEELKRKHSVVCENSGVGLYEFCLPVPNNNKDALDAYEAFLKDIKVHSSRPHVQSRMALLAKESLEEFSLFTFGEDLAQIYVGNHSLSVKAI
ncbi:hypothetical protein OTK49_21310 [Vibrio coralliirubri]|uniref:hypothetical protein n=1 Tax=Vibrio coralliirubri TaxID=1516159 RepID=UPI002284D26B|nr:hypothetical protein [Vibrio coralliirubri]MCY9865060.1 hypothetical protein [Vibrio coralliirubri]